MTRPLPLAERGRDALRRDPPAVPPVFHDPRARADAITRARALLADFPAHTGDVEAAAAAARLIALSPDHCDHARAREVLAVLDASLETET